MSQHFYAVSSLPFLTYDLDPIPGREFFLDIIRTHLSASELKIAASALDFDPDSGKTDNVFLEKWRVFETNLRNELVQLRARKKGRDSDSLRECEETISPRQLARTAFQQESPQAAEDLLSRGRWAYVEELEVGYFFDLEKLLAYALKLGILLRKARFQANRGAAEFEAQIAVLKKTITDREYSYDKQ